MHTNSAGVLSRTKFTEDGSMIRQDTQDIGFALTANKQERNSGDNDQSGKNGRKFASVPVIVLQTLKDQLGIDYNLVGTCPDHTGRFFLWLRDNPSFRTSEARLDNGNRYVS